MRKRAVHYVASDKPVGEEIEKAGPDCCQIVSAGHERHEYTTGCAYEKIFTQFGFI